MNSKEFLAVLADRTGLSLDEASLCSDALTEIMAGHLCENDSLSVQGFGLFEVKKKNERVIFNPATRHRMLVPPKLVVSFKPSANLKERLK